MAIPDEIPRAAIDAVGDFGYHRAPEGIADSPHGLGAVARVPDWNASLLCPVVGDWVLAVRGPIETLKTLCDTKPDGAPVKFVTKMRLACERMGLVLERRAGCVLMGFHTPSRPGRLSTFWFPMEAVGVPSVSEGATHIVRLLDNLELVKKLCNTKPDECPVKYISSLGKRVGRHGALLESRGHIVQVKFFGENRTGYFPDSDNSKNELIVWLPKEAVVLATPWRVNAVASRRGGDEQAEGEREANA